MWVGCNPCPGRGRQFRGWAIAVVAAILIAGCSSSRDKRAEDSEADEATAAAGEEAGDVLAAFEAWANDSESAEKGAADGAGTTSAGNPGGNGRLDGVIEQFNRKVSACWKQPFAMPRLATVRLLVQFNPDGTIRDVVPRPEASEALLYRTKAPYLVMIAQTSQALRQCQPYEGIRQNFAKLSQLEMVVDPRMFQN